ncbi:MAG: NTP transferase domain-containing protein [Chthoniobacterales bacterium]|nr:NTP transferase domain-containing protein [Chthoniobacterales bacterium]
MLINTTAIILAGGNGSRLKELTKETPKPLLNIAGKPFLFYLLDYLNNEGITEVVLAIGYLASQFKQTIGEGYKNITIKYSIEAEPLGTGGALTQALTMTSQENIFVFNGDTLFKGNLKMLQEIHREATVPLSLMLRYVEDTARYGKIDFKDKYVRAIQEKGKAGPGYINGGVYLLCKNQWPIMEEKTYSLESETLPFLISTNKVACVVSNDYFIDIGILEDFYRGQSELMNFSDR